MPAAPGPGAPPATLLESVPTRAFPTLSVAYYSEGYAIQPIDPLALLKQQWHKLQAARDPVLVSVEGPEPTTARPWYRMEYIEPARTLRSVLRAGEPVTLDFVIELARALERLEADPVFQYHGDLKPENALVTPTGPRLLDPGYFGPLAEASSGSGRWAPERDVMVTTPAYNHHLSNGDASSLGVMLWEIACGQHPFSTILLELRSGRSHSFGPSWHFFGDLHNTGAGLTPDLRTRTAQDGELRDLLDSAVRRFPPISEIVAALDGMRARGVEYLRLCGDPSCASLARQRCAECAGLFCLDHCAAHPDASGAGRRRCTRCAVSPRD